MVERTWVNLGSNSSEEVEEQEEEEEVSVPQVLHPKHTAQRQASNLNDKNSHWV